MFGHVGELPIPFIAIKCVLRRGIEFGPFQRRSVKKIYFNVSVSVLVEKCHTRSDRLNQVPLAAAAVGVPESYPRFLRNITKDYRIAGTCLTKDHYQRQHRHEVVPAADPLPNTRKGVPVSFSS